MIMGRSKIFPNLKTKEDYLKKIFRIITVVLLIAAAYCGYFFAHEYRIMQDEISEYSDLRDKYITVTQTPVCDTSDITQSPDKVGLPIIEIDFDPLLLINPDTVGWITIPDSVISYPVVQTSNNTKYLNTSFVGSFAKTGTPFADKDNNMQHLDTNTIIYGHNMGTGRMDMFSTLLLYKDFEYFTEHRYIKFDTIYQYHGWWKVFAIIEIDIRSTGFHYQQKQFTNDEDFTDWLSQVTALSIHDMDMELSPNDYILTLSTCDRGRYGQHGRFLILAVQTSGHFVHR
jgi:sortase B